MEIELREIEVGSDLHRSEQTLRDAVLRRPLGRTLSAADTERDREGRHFVALQAGAVVACAGLYPQAVPGVMRLRQMAVSPDVQGRGAGAAVLRFAEDRARESGVTRIETHARVSARGFYKRCGYTAEGAEFVEVTLPHIFMWKAL